MAKRIFIGFAIEDVRYRDFLVAQAKNERSPFEFVDMSVKQPWETDWESKCKQRILGCDGMIALVSKNTVNASGARYEIRCATDGGIPLMPMFINDDRNFYLPSELTNKRVNIWSWDNLKTFVNGL